MPDLLDMLRGVCVSFLVKESAGVPLLGGLASRFLFFMLVLLFLWCLHTGPCLLHSILAGLFLLLW